MTTSFSLLPAPLRRDLSLHALEEGITHLSALDLKPIVLYDFDQVSPAALLHLAEQFAVLGDAGWDAIGDGADADLQKRRLLKQAIALHRIKGTRYAVTEALKALGVKAQINEWFDLFSNTAAPEATRLHNYTFNGRLITPSNQPNTDIPHTFIVGLNLDAQDANATMLDSARMEQIRRIVSFWKPARSHFNLRLELDTQLHLRTASIFSGTQAIYSSGALDAFNVVGSTALRSASIGGASSLLSSYGSLLQ